MKEKKISEKYSLWGNTKYVLGNLWCWDKKYFLLGFLKIPLTVAAAFLPILISKLIVDAVVQEKAPSQMVVYIGSVIGMMIIVSWVSTWIDSIIVWHSKQYRFKYISMINQKRMTTDYENLITQEGQYLLNRALAVTSHDGASAQRVLNIIISFLTSSLGLFSYSTFLMLLSPWVIVVLVIAGYLNYATREWQRKYYYRLRKEYTPLDTKLNYLISRSGDLSNAKDIRLYQMGSWFKDMFKIILDKRMVFEVKVRKALFITLLIDAPIRMLKYIVPYSVLIYKISQGELALGDFILYLGLVNGFADWLFTMADKITQYKHFVPEVTDLRRFLDMEEKINREGLTPPKCDCYELRLQNVCYRYKGSNEDTLKHINLTIRAGEKLAIVGANGAGKTTLVSLLCGLLAPTSGKVLLNGVDIHMYNTKQYFELFSAVFQNIKFLPMSIEDNIKLGKENGTDREVVECLKLAGLDKKVTSLAKEVHTKLIKNIYDDAVELSGGESQKLALARAIYKDAPCLILDEPTAALDPIAESEIYQQYHQLSKGKTCLFISHRLSSTQFCDRIAFLEAGEIKEVGNHESLMALKGGYAQMFDVQSYYYKKQLEEKRCF